MWKYSIYAYSCLNDYCMNHMEIPHGQFDLYTDLERVWLSVRLLFMVNYTDNSKTIFFKSKYFCSKVVNARCCMVMFTCIQLPVWLWLSRVSNTITPFPNLSQPFRWLFQSPLLKTSYLVTQVSLRTTNVNTSNYNQDLPTMR